MPADQSFPANEVQALEICRNYQHMNAGYISAAAPQAVKLLNALTLRTQANTLVCDINGEPAPTIILAKTKDGQSYLVRPPAGECGAPRQEVLVAIRAVSRAGLPG